MRNKIEKIAKELQKGFIDGINDAEKKSKWMGEIGMSMCKKCDICKYHTKYFGCCNPKTYVTFYVSGDCSGYEPKNKGDNKMN